MIYLSIFTMLSALSFFFEDRIGIGPPIWNLIQFGRFPIPIFGPWLGAVLTWAVPFGFVSFYPSTHFLARDEFRLLCYLTPLVAVGFALAALAVWGLGGARLPQHRKLRPTLRDADSKGARPRTPRKITPPSGNLPRRGRIGAVTRERHPRIRVAARPGRTNGFHRHDPLHPIRRRRARDAAGQPDRDHAVRPAPIWPAPRWPRPCCA